MNEEISANEAPPKIEDWVEARPEDSAEPMTAANSKPRPYAPAPSVCGKSALQRSVYILLGVLLGGLGIHNFYAGRTRAAVVQILLTVFFCWTLVVPVAVWLYAIVECLTTRVDGEGKWLR